MALKFENLQGRVIDLDSHENIPSARWGHVFGKVGQQFYDVSETMLKLIEETFGKDETNTKDYEDKTEITPQTVWEVKGGNAPSAENLDRRPAVLDQMGIRRQLIFPSFGLLAFATANGGGGIAGLPMATDDAKAISWKALDVYNEWAGDLTSKYPDRMRVVGVLSSSKPGLTVDELVAETKRLIGMGVRGVFIASGQPPAGISPASRLLDPWYATLAEANVSICMHSGGGNGYRASEMWGFDQAFRFHHRDDTEYTAGPFFAANVHQAEENFIAAMVLGGVFERHPNLRVGAIELLAHWIGPLAERMDFLCDAGRHMDWEGGKALKLKPSEYLARHVRVTPLVFEPVDKYVERYPYMQDVYCYSSDFPHPEGNKWSMKRFYDQLAPKVSDTFLRKFFIENGELLVP